MMKPEGIIYRAPKMTHQLIEVTPVLEFEAMVSANMMPQMMSINASNLPSFFSSM